MEGIQDSINRIKQAVEHSAKKRKRFEDAEARYTMVWHGIRNKFGLSINEYCLADTIHKLSGNHSEIPGWCFASKQRLGKNIGVTRQSIHAMLKKLKEKGLIEIQQDTSYLRTTKLWVEEVELMKSRVYRSR